MDKFSKINKGGRGSGQFLDGELEFLKPEASPWKDDYSGASESGTYQSRRFDDNTGHFRGSNWDDSESHGLVNKQADEAQASIRDIGDLIDRNERDPRDSSWRGSGRKGPKYSNPLGRSGQGNMRGHK
jgi:hypothetical protein